MGNACCTDERDKLGNRGDTRIPFRADSLKIAATEESFDEFGSKLRDKYFKLNHHIADSLKKYGLYKFEESVADLRGSEALPVKYATNDQITYYGQMLGNKLHGKGHMQTKAGDLYVCPFYEGQARGTGAVYFANGDYFFGRLLLGDLEEGRMVYQDGTEYQGQFVNKKRSGKGSLIFLDGKKYEGQWMNDKQNGPGKLITYGYWNDGKLVSVGNATHNMQSSPHENAIIQSPIKSIASFKPVLSTKYILETEEREHQNTTTSIDGRYGR